MLNSQAKHLTTHAAANTQVSKASYNFTFALVTSAVATTVGQIYVGLGGSDSLVIDASHIPQYASTLGASQSA